MKEAWTRLALLDLESHVDYVAQHHVTAAFEIEENIYDAVRGLLTYPMMGRAGQRPGTRELVVAGSSYFIVYRIDGDTITVLRVMHGAQNWP